MQTLLPEISLNVSAPIIDPHGLFLHRPEEIWLEIGFGGGEHLAHQASIHRDVGFFGCEPFINGAAKLLSTVAALKLENVRVHTGDAVELIDCLPAASISCIYLLYPDPWPKRRQRKRRLVSDESLLQLARILKPDGTLKFATDIDDLAAWTLARILRSQEFSWNVGSSKDWLQPWHDWPGTRYELKAMEAGRPCAYFTFERN